MFELRVLDYLPGTIQKKHILGRSTKTVTKSWSLQYKTTSLPDWRDVEVVKIPFEDWYELKNDEEIIK